MSNNVIAESAGNCLVCVQDFSLQYTGSQMVSSVEGNLYPPHVAGDPQVVLAWSKGSVSRDPAVTDTLAAFTAATGQDRRSQFVEGALVVDGGYALLPAYAAAQGSVAVPVPSDIASVSRLPGNGATLGALPGDDVSMGSLLAVGARALTMVIALVCGVLTTRMIIGGAGVDSFALYTLLTTIPSLLTFTDLGSGRCWSTPSRRARTCARMRSCVTSSRRSGACCSCSRPRRWRSTPSWCSPGPGSWCSARQEDAPRLAGRVLLRDDLLPGHPSRRLGADHAGTAPQSHRDPPPRADLSADHDRCLADAHVRRREPALLRGHRVLRGILPRLGARILITARTTSP